MYAEAWLCTLQVVRHLYSSLILKGVKSAYVSVPFPLLISSLSLLFQF